MKQTAPADSAAFRDTEHLSSVIKHTDVSAVQLSRGSFHAELTHRTLGGWTLQFITFHEGTSTASGSAAADRHSFLIPLEVHAPCRLLGDELTADRMAIYAPGGEHADVSSGGLAEVVLTPPPELLDKAADRGEQFELDRSGSTLRSVPLRELDAFRQVLGRCRELPASSPTADPTLIRSVNDALELALVATLSQGMAIPASGRLPLPRAAVLARINAALEQNPDEPLYASELAQLAGVSYPTLRRIFVEWFGVSPVRYLLLRRLYLARRRILGGDCRTVTEAATLCGFWELGRFAKRYSELFGELPSATLSRVSGSRKASVA